MSTDLSNELARIDQLVEQNILETRRERDETLRDFGAAVRWLLLVPVWTQALAHACEFPQGTDPTSPILERLREEGLCQSREVSGLDLDVRPFCEYWMPPDLRQRELRRMQEETLADGQSLRDLSHKLGLKLSAPEVRELVPAPTRRWAQLAVRGTEPKALVDEFHARIEGLLGAASTPNSPEAEEALIAEAMSWVRTAQYLEPIFGPMLGAVATAASRRIDFLQIRREDERRLKHYIPREEQLLAFLELWLAPVDTSAWALHFVGKAGVGKTMLVRHLCTRIISKEGGTWARVDFDHLNPAYPTQAPWLLIEQLAEQLFLQGGPGRFSRSLNWFDRTRLMVREIAGASARSWQDIQRTPTWQEMLRAFAGILHELDGPIFLLFDTCEELAKLSSWDEPANVAATFQLLEALHQLVPQLRVLFFGRRALASSGRDWRLANPEPWLPTRSFLRLHEMQSFSQQEVELYFNQPRVNQRPLTPELRMALLAKTREDSWTSAFRVAVSFSATGVERFNPFDVVLYTDWVREDARVTPEDLAVSGRDRYVELRIVERLDNADLVKLLPMVAVLGRFDEALLRDTWTGAPEAFEAAFRELIRQDWVQLDASHFQVDERLRRRLEAHFRATKPAFLREASRRAAERIEQLTLEQPVEGTAGFHYVLGARLLRDAPERAMSWWRGIEQRAVGSGGFLALGAVCVALLADEAPLASDSPASVRPFRAQVLATLAASRVHQGRAFPDDWMEVERSTDDILLRIRALLGQFIAANASGSAIPPARVRRLWDQAEHWHLETWDEPLQAAWVGALEAIVEQVERDKPLSQLSVPLLSRTANWAATANISPALAGFALATVARAFVLVRKKPKEVAKCFLKAIAQVRVGPTKQQWLDWKAPEDMGARIRLEMVRSLYPDVFSADQLLKSWAEVDGEGIVRQWGHLDPSGADQDRLCSAFLHLTSAVQPPREPLGQLEAMGWAARRSQFGTPACNAHWELPISSIAYARCLGEMGLLNTALDALRKAVSLEQKTAHTVNGAIQAGVVRLEILRRMRDPREGMSLDEVLVNVPPAAPEHYFHQYAPPMARMGLEQPNLTGMLGVWAEHEHRLKPWLHHACWRALPVLDAASARLAVTWAFEHPAPVEDPAEDFWALSLLLDTVEAAQLESQFGMAPVFTARWTFDAWRWTKGLSTPQALRLLLRAQSLGLQVSPQRIAKLIRKLGPRAAAQLAMDEGELLALRLPGPGAQLLATAVEWFWRSEDHEGFLLSSLTRIVALLRLPHPNLERLQGELHSSLELLPLTSGLGSTAPFLSGGLVPASLPDQLLALADANADWRQILLRAAATQAAIQDLSDGSSLFERMILNTPLIKRPLPTEIQALSEVLSKAQARSIPPPASISPLAPMPQHQPAPPLRRSSLLVTARPSAPRPEDAPVGGAGPVHVELNAIEGRLEPTVLYQHRAYETMAWRLRPSLSTLPSFEQWTGGEAAFAVAPQVSGLCWEAIIATALRSQPLEQLSVDLRRVSILSVPVSTLWVRPLQHVGVELGHALSQRRLMQRWLDTAPQRTPRVLGRGEDLEPDATAASVDLLYLRASALPTASGPRMELTTSEHSEHRSLERQKLISAEHLIAWMPKLRVCVLTGPQLLDTQRVESDRLRAATARGFAAELAASGQLTAVLVIPSLPEELEFEMNALVAQAFTHPDWDQALVSVVREVRTHVYRALGQTDDAWEVAMDCCLYMPPQAQLHS
ncbi:ATP-binding protein [Corallococcus sp. AB032C]|uniref:ATP-binding protein n=1 Tax=Corallococcus TaxID=83461 RepID=UPI000EBF3D64|nr:MULTISPECIES: ATP-binding protein [Corallococcus]NPC49170.1 ATP-binding protein [Corallococcus exiguus]RKH76059.1 ATP-binding protein [Corallococcus sp. AB032C]